MADSLETLKAELERFGHANDAATSERPRRMLNITRDTGEFLVVLVRATAARRVLEIGTSQRLLHALACRRGEGDRRLGHYGGIR